MVDDGEGDGNLVIGIQRYPHKNESGGLAGEGKESYSQGAEERVHPENSSALLHHQWTRYRAYQESCTGGGTWAGITSRSLVRYSVEDSPDNPYLLMETTVASY